KSGNNCKFYQASSSEMFGISPPPQDESTPFQPRSPYACAKLMAHWMAVNYREGYKIFAASGILFNHESPRRSETFVTRKITRGIAMILAGKQNYLFLGNLEPKRDWGFAPEYVEMMWKMLQNDTPGDFVIGTGESHSIKQFMEEAFLYSGLDWREYIKIDPKYFRPTEVEALRADSTNARKSLGWEPRVKFDALVRIMVDADMRRLGLEARGEGDRILKEKFPGRWWGVD
ncbi:MAG: GDP-mannose 4,6-dehydratase, partial [Thermodesulfobacteriota bacterium]